MYGKKSMGIERSTFLIGADGKIARTWRKVKVPGPCGGSAGGREGPLTPPIPETMTAAAAAILSIPDAVEKAGAARRLHADWQAGRFAVPGQPDAPRRPA